MIMLPAGISRVLMVDEVGEGLQRQFGRKCAHSSDAERLSDSCCRLQCRNDDDEMK